jgi:hypothetical protein
MGKPCEKDLPLLKTDITNNLEPQKPVIYSRYPNLKKAEPLLALPIQSNFQMIKCYLLHISRETMD